MYNLLSTLLILTATITGFRQGVFFQNQLYHLGLLVLLGYLFGLGAERIKLPAVFGYIAAGIIAGPGGTGLIAEPFLDNMTNVSGFLIMLMLAASASRMCRESGVRAARFFLSGGAISLLFLGITFLFLLIDEVSIASRIGYGLFAAAFSPLILDALYPSDADTREHLTAFGGLSVTVVLWGIAIAISNPGDQHQMRMAFMPAIIALTSAVCGYSLGFAAHMLSNEIPRWRSQFQVVALFFIFFPLIGHLGLDYLFVGAGFGVFCGVISTDCNRITIHPLISIIVFAIFGLSLKIESMLVMNAGELRLTAILTTAIIVSRLMVFPLMSRILKRFGELPLHTRYFLPIGPISFILLIRFVPGLQLSTDVVNEQFLFHRICTASICIILTVTAIHMWTVRAIKNLKNIKYMQNSSS